MIDARGILAYYPKVFKDNDEIKHFVITSVGENIIATIKIFGTLSKWYFFNIAIAILDFSLLLHI